MKKSFILSTLFSNKKLCFREKYSNCPRLTLCVGFWYENSLEIHVNTTTLKIYLKKTINLVNIKQNRLMHVGNASNGRQASHKPFGPCSAFQTAFFYTFR